MTYQYVQDKITRFKIKHEEVAATYTDVLFQLTNHKGKALSTSSKSLFKALFTSLKAVFKSPKPLLYHQKLFLHSINPFYNTFKRIYDKFGPVLMI